MSEYIEEGYILLSRKLLESPTWKAFTHKQQAIALHCLLRANHKNTKWYDGEKKVLIERGTFITSIEKLAKETKTTVKTVRCFFLKSARLGFTAQRGIPKRAQGYTVITICNYDRYQNPENYKGHKDIPLEGHARGIRGATNNNDNNEKNVYSAEFESLWKEYPNRLGKDKAHKSFLKTVKTPDDHSSIQTALSNYKKHLSLNTWKKPQNGSTWFNNWREWKEYKEREPQQDEPRLRKFEG